MLVKLKKVEFDFIVLKILLKISNIQILFRLNYYHKIEMIKFAWIRSTFFGLNLLIYVRFIYDIALYYIKWSAYIYILYYTSYNLFITLDQIHFQFFRLRTRLSRNNKQCRYNNELIFLNEPFLKMCRALYTGPDNDISVWCIVMISIHLRWWYANRFRFVNYFPRMSGNRSLVAGSRTLCVQSPRY